LAAERVDERQLVAHRLQAIRHPPLDQAVLATPDGIERSVELGPAEPEQLGLLNVTELAIAAYGREAFAPPISTSIDLVLGLEGVGIPGRSGVGGGGRDAADGDRVHELPAIARPAHHRCVVHAI
jgi:hypothetical protein